MATAAYRRANTTSEHDSSSSSEGNTTDEEYFKIIGGIDDTENDEEEAPWMKEMRESFENADINRDGTLSLTEMISMMNKERQKAPPELAARMEALELKVKETNEKLDRILELLQPPEKKGGIW